MTISNVKTSTTIPQTTQVVTIAGTDSGGGAGVQADLKTFQARQVFGTNIIVALTAQNTLGVQSSFPVPLEFITAQFNSLAADLQIKAAKTGMLADKAHVDIVVENLKKVDFGPLVVDPVMIAKGGHPLLLPEAVDSIKTKLLPITTVVTPNLPETEVLVGHAVSTTTEIYQAAKELQRLGAKNIVIKGGHQTGPMANDYVLLASGKDFWLQAPRIETKNTHGTGDTFSACLAAELAKGNSIESAIITAKKFIQGAIENPIKVGHGHGPTNHWATESQNVKVLAKLQ